MAVAIPAAIIGGAIISGLASNSAANTQASAGASSIAAQESMFQDMQANERPYMQAGQDALGQIQGNMAGYNKPFTMADFTADPGYQFELAQGLQAVKQGASGMGGLSGNEQAASANYVQGLAGTEYQNAFNRYQTQITNSYNRLSNLVGIGQNAAAGTGAQSTQVGANIGNTMTGVGNAQAAGQVGMANAVNSGIGQGINAYNTSNLMDFVKNNQTSGGNALAGYNPTNSYNYQNPGGMPTDSQYGQMGMTGTPVNN